MKSRFLSIQIKTFLVFGTFIALTLAGAGWGVSRYFESVARRQIERQQSDMVSLLASALDDKLFRHLDTLQAVARGIPGRAPSDPGTASAWLKDQRGIRALFENGIFLLRPDGRLLAANAVTPPSPALQAELHPFFQAVAASGDGGISEAYRSESSGAPAVMMAVPWIEQSSRVRVLLAGSIDLRHGDFLGAIVNRRMPDASHLSLIDAQGRILMHPDPTRILTRARHFEGWNSRTGLGVSGERRDASGILTLTSVQPLKAVPWTLAAIIPLSQAHAPIGRFRGYLRDATAAGVFATLLLAWLLSHGLTKNLESFTAQIEAAATQPVGQRRIQSRVHDETSILVDAFNGLMASLDDKAARLLQAKARQDEELALAKHVLQRLVEPGLRAMPDHLHMETLQTQRINGDACAYQEGLPGIHFGLICDATGHGLTAGISTLPAIQSFLGMVRRDIPLETIYAEINRKVLRMMPTERFVCLLLMRLDTQSGTLTVLNAGLPDAVLCTPQGGCRRFTSRNLPAGILVGLEAPVIETVKVAPGDRLLAYTDGILDLFPAEETDQVFLHGLERCPLGVHLRAVQETLSLAIANQEQHDDVSWALWEVPPPACVRPQVATSSLDASAMLLEDGFTLALTLLPHRHAVRDVLPEALRILSSHGLGVQAEQSLTLALTEALANAVDHGVLGLDSRLKEQGFEVYESLRNLHLAAIHEGYVKLTLRLRTLPSGPVREVDVEVEDSGSGFDWRAWEKGASDTLRPSGRGLLLIRALTTNLSFNEAGNRIRFTLPCD